MSVVKYHVQCTFEIPFNEIWYVSYSFHAQGSEMSQGSYKFDLEWKDDIWMVWKTLNSLFKKIHLNISQYFNMINQTISPSFNLNIAKNTLGNPDKPPTIASHTIFMMMDHSFYNIFFNTELFNPHQLLSLF